MSKSLKGGRFEREVCTVLSLWWTGGWPEPQGDKFWRTAGSGARATTRAKKGRETSGHHGDISATDHVGIGLLKLFAIEIKRGYSKCSIMDVLDKPKAKKNAIKEVLQVYEDWFLECERKRDQSGALHWLLITKRDKRRPLVFMPEEAAIKLGLGMPPGLALTTDKFTVWGMLLDDFFGGLKPERCLALVSPVPGKEVT